MTVVWLVLETLMWSYDYKKGKKIRGLAGFFLSFFLKVKDQYFVRK